MKGKLTPRQQIVFDFVTEYIDTNGMPPTVREIAEGLGFKSPNSVQEHLRLIEKKGYLELKRGIARGIFPVVEEATSKEDIPTNITHLPLIGAVAAGIPITAEENIEHTIAIDADLFGGDNLFTFKVAGDSMEEAGIFSGDFVIVHKQSTAQNGDKIVAFLDGDTTLKTYFKDKNHIILHPENSNYEDIIVEPFTNFYIVGKMVGLIRKY